MTVVICDMNTMKFRFEFLTFHGPVNIHACTPNHNEPLAVIEWLRLLRASGMTTKALECVWACSSAGEHKAHHFRMAFSLCSMSFKVPLGMRSLVPSTNAPVSRARAPAWCVAARWVGTMYTSVK